MARLSDADVTAGLAKLQGWARNGDTIAKSYKFQRFADGIRFVDRVAVEADKLDHHPDIDIRWTTVTMTLSTHSEGGLTKKDLALAAVIDGVKG